MKSMTKLLALLLVIVMLFTSCEFLDKILGKNPPVDCTVHTDADKDGKCDSCGTAVEAEPVTFDVTFMSRGSAYSKVTVEEGETAAAPADPTRAGYTFKGWFTDEACTTPWNPSSAVTSDTTVYAGYNKNDGEVVVTFISGGEIYFEVAVAAGSRGTNIKPGTPTRDGFRFLGWYTDEACTATWKTIDKIEADTTIYAGWKEIYVFDRSANSTSPEEILTWYTLTDDYVAETAALINTMVSCAKAADLDGFDVAYGEFDTRFYHIAEQMTVASIIYYCNMKDEAAQERHLGTSEKLYDIQDKYNIALREIYTTVDEATKAVLFEGWTEEDIAYMLTYDSASVALRKEIDELQVQYNELDDTSGLYEDQVIDIYKQIVLKNNALARLQKKNATENYTNYYEYASKEVYGRDYDSAQLAEFRALVKDNISSSLEDLYEAYAEASSKLTGKIQEEYNSFNNKDFDAMDDNYLMMYLNSLGDTTMGVAMRDVFDSKNCVFADSPNSHPTAFQTWLYESDKPFCLFGSSGQTASTMVHEIGHYYAAYVNDDINNYDLCETHSQGNEFLFLDFCKDHLTSSIYRPTRAYMIWSTSITITIATMVDDFEYRVYSLSDEEIANMTTADFDAIMTDVCNYYGAGAEWINDNLVTDAYEYWKLVAIDNPLYYVSYAISGVEALNLAYEIETDRDAALTSYRALVEGVTEDDGFLGALAKAGLSTPFDKETYTHIKSLYNS